jgi:hypothetical protein
MTFLVAVTRTVAEKDLPSGVAAGTTVAATVVSLLNAADNSVVQTQTVTDGSLITSFSGVSAGDYVVSAQDQDSSGAAIGDAVTLSLPASSFDTTTPPANTYQGTSALSVSVTAEGDQTAPAV